MSEIETHKTRIETSVEKMREAVRAVQQAGESVGFVPTMGALHKGHLSLVEASLSENDHTVVSIFVNPTQFAPNEDLANYPRNLDRDLELLQQRGCWIVFAPAEEEVYPPGYETKIDVGSVALPWEGASRPIHFGGVATVVLKLFQIVPADRAYFGKKDYQQTLVVRRMVTDLNVPIEIRVCPIVREADGLAMSSRNAYLNPEERQQATALWKSLQLAKELYAAGENSAAVIQERMKEFLQSFQKVELEYIAVLRQGTVSEVETLDGENVIAMAARVGKTRLIDNHSIG